MLNWLKRYIGARAIRELDNIEPIISAKIREGQGRINEIPPEQFAKELIDSFQLFLCKKLDVDPKRVGLEQ